MVKKSMIIYNILGNNNLCNGEREVAILWPSQENCLAVSTNESILMGSPVLQLTPCMFTSHGILFMHQHSENGVATSHAGAEKAPPGLVA